MKKIFYGGVASLDVDAQKGFSPICPDELPVPEGDKIVPELNAQAKYAFMRAGSKDAHPRNPVWLAGQSHPVMSKVVGQPDADLYWPAHCVPGTPGFELLPGLPKPEEYDYFVWKGIEPHLHPYGACFHDLLDTRSTGLIEWLVDNKINTVIVGGLATDYCVMTTCIQLLILGFKVILNLGASRAIDPGSIAAKIYEVKKTFNSGERGELFKVINSAAELEELIQVAK
jgi:nicotinamidase/pyrazinamidase